MTSNKAEIDFGNLYNFLVHDPYNTGFRQLSVVAGFASSAVVRQVLLDYPGVRLKLIIGMAGGTGISDSDHKIYIDLAENIPERLECLYYIGRPLVHAKFYIWQQGGAPDFGIVTSANFSWTGLGGYFEAGVCTDPAPLLMQFSRLRERSISVISSEVGERVKIFTTSPRTATEVSASHGSPRSSPIDESDRVTLSLLTASGEVHNKSGLNWGQRDGREPNQAYIPVPALVHQQHPGFFPPRGRRFIVRTDDGQTLTCVIAQGGSKAIETPDDNSALGLYFRTRIGVKSGEYVSSENLNRYGRINVEFTKIDEDLFFMNFSAPDSPH